MVIRDDIVREINANAAVIYAIIENTSKDGLEIEGVKFAPLSHRDFKLIAGRLSHSTVIRLVDKLIEKGYVEKRSFGEGVKLWYGIKK